MTSVYSIVGAPLPGRPGRSFGEESAGIDIPDPPHMDRLPQIMNAN